MDGVRIGVSGITVVVFVVCPVSVSMPPASVVEGLRRMSLGATCIRRA